MQIIVYGKKPLQTTAYMTLVVPILINFFLGTPKNNSYKFCPYCGKPLITVYEVTKQLKKEKKTCQI